MYNNIKKEKEIISLIITDLLDLKLFLIGNTSDENVVNDRKSPECLQDEVINNVNDLDYIRTQVNVISKAIKGDINER